MLNLLAQVDLGKITPPTGTVPTASNPTTFATGLVRNSIYLLIIVAFVIGVIWMIFAGYSFIFAGDDSKKIGAAWSKIYWILIGLVIVVGAFAMIKLVQGFFGIDIIGNICLPTIKSTSC